MIGLLIALLAVACGGPPSERDIFHDPALRPGSVEAASEEERQVLRRIDGATSTIEVGGQTYSLEPPYYAASGRRCRGVLGGSGRRLACDSPSGWVFVPDLTTTSAGGNAP
ncbi:MAG TPA: hypothetical protein ENK57_10275 [Polyangiaceae bacterium]|nr:hypothetical protein [Polyangiaceae bacterium]